MPLRGQVRLEEFPEGPPDGGQHGQASMFQLGITIADEALSIGGQTKRVEARVAGESHFVQNFGPVQERQPVCKSISESVLILHQVTSRRDRGRAG